MALAATAALGLEAAGFAVAAGLLAESDAECREATVSAFATADSWIGEDSPLAGKGTDSILSVDAGSLNPDTALTSGRARALVRFPQPSAVPPGCVVESARLYLFSVEEDVGTRVEAVRLASGWSENAASWSDQPETVGGAAGSWSREGYMQWNVTSHVRAIYAGGGNHGFLVRDAAEATAVGGGGHAFYAREKGESAPQLVIRFASPPTDEPPGEPQPPAPAMVRCGEVLTQSTLVTNDLSGCPGDGLVVGAPRIVVDLGGHTIDGVGLGAGIRNDGNASVAVRNGTVQEFDHGVQLLSDTKLNVVEELALLRNEVAAIELFDVAGSEIRLNRLDENGGGISLVSGTTASVVADNTITANGQAALLIRDSSANRLERNRVIGGGDLGIALERAGDNTVLGNTVAGASDGGIELHAGSHGNRIESNIVTESGDHGILVSESNRNVLISNVAQDMSDSGITLESADDSVVRGNDVRFNSDGLQLDGSSRNLLESNDASNAKGIGIELGGGSLGNHLLRNTAAANGAQGIYVADEAPLDAGNRVERNDAVGNRSDGIVVAKPGHTIVANVARDNSGWGINAAADNVDGGLNVATGNGKPDQCTGVVCRAEWNQPESAITSGPADPTNSTSATFGFIGNVDGPQSVLVFQCSLDSAPFVPCASPHAYAGLAPGAHTFRTRAIDTAGNVEAEPAAYTWTIDIAPPDAAIDVRPADPTNSHDAAFEFSADEPGSRFECALDEPVLTPCTSPASYVALMEGTHRFRVVAIDRAGNVDPTPASHVWTVDASAPETELGERPPAASTRTDATFTFASEPGATFQCKLDDEPFAGCASPHIYTGLPPGSHRFEVRAIDPAGNSDASPATFDWLVEAPTPPADSGPPETEILSGPADPTNRTAAGLTFGGSDDLSDASALRFQCRLDSLAETAWQPCASPHDYPGPLSPGRHSFEVRALDEAGNLDDSPAGYSWTIDTSPPETELGERPPAATTDTGATFTFTSEPGATFECGLDGSAFVGCESPVTYTGLDLGTHHFQVLATDAAGNSDSTAASYWWTIVDASAPETAITAQPAASTGSTSATFEFTGIDNATPATGLAFECSLDTAAFATCTSPKSYSSLTVGTHTFRVRATDAARNVDATPASYAWTITAAAPACPATTTLVATADAWIDQNSPSNNKGADSILKVQSKGPGDNFRTLVRFSLPARAQGCIVVSATLRLYAASSSAGRTLLAIALAAGWSESTVTWNDQPPTSGAAATTSSGLGYREWNVSSQMQAVYDGAPHEGFLIRDAAENADAEQQFHSREKREHPPQLVLRFGAAGAS